MNAFNRIFTIVILAALLVVGVFVLITPAGFLGLMHAIADWFRGTVFAAYSDTGRILVRLILALIWAALLGVLIWLEVRRPGSRDIEIARYTGGSAIRISTDAVQDKVKEQIDAISGVLDARVRATGRNRAVELKLDVVVIKDLDLVAKAEEIAAVTRQVVQDQLGLKLAGKPQVAIRAKTGKAGSLQPTPDALPAPLHAADEAPAPPLPAAMPVPAPIEPEATASGLFDDRGQTQFDDQTDSQRVT